MHLTPGQQQQEMQSIVKSILSSKLANVDRMHLWESIMHSAIWEGGRQEIAVYLLVQGLFQLSYCSAFCVFKDWVEKGPPFTLSLCNPTESTITMPVL